MLPKKHDLRSNWAALCRHEVGHHVVARMCGFKVGSIGLQIDLNGVGSGEAEVILAGAVESLDEVASYLERRVKILYAGAAAEALRGKTVDQSRAIEILQNSGGESDWARARDCIQLLRNVRFPDEADDDEIQRQLDGLRHKLWPETVAMIEKCADVISLLVKMMEGKVTPNERVIFSKEEIEEVEGIPGLGETDLSQP